MGPSASAGMNVSAPTMTMTPTEQHDEERPVTGKRAGARRDQPSSATSAPASARTGTFMKKRPKNIAMPRMVL